MEKDKHFDIFISYRRDGGEIMARLLYFMLTNRGYTVFYDREAMDSGRFDKNIQKAIENCTDFILILSPHIFRKREEGKVDHVLEELKWAGKNNKNILPLIMQGFDYKEMREYGMPEELMDFDKIHAEPIPIASFDYTYIKRKIRLHSKPANRAGALTEALRYGNEKASNPGETFSNIPDPVKKDTIKEHRFRRQRFVMRVFKKCLGDSVKPER